MKKNSMRLLGFLLAAVMMVSLLGLGVFAEDTAVADLAQLNAALDAGNTAISVAEDITVEDLEIPAGVTVTIAEGKTLRVLGTLDNQGAIEGAGTVSVAVMVYVVETRTPFEGVSYDVRATKNGSVTGNAPAAAVKYEISLDGGNTWIADTTNGKAQAVTVKTDGTTVVSSSFQSAFTSALSGETVHMLKDVHVQSTNSKKNNGPLRSYYGLILEGNGHTIFTDLESSGASNEYATIKFTSYLAGTGPDVRPVLKNVTIDSQKNAKADLDFVSGDVTFTVSLFNVNLLGNCQYASFAMKSPAMIINKSNVEIYDSTIPSWDIVSANAINFYSGSYNLSFNSKCTMYGGDYSKDPTNYVAEGYEVEQKDDGRYYVQKAVTYVAQVGDTKYETLANAILFAQPGDTITLLTDVTEDVTFNKALTLDGADKTYTGKMTVTADITIKNVNFDGKGYNGYAVETRSAAKVVIEDCTAKNYGYGFLQVASNNDTVTVKNVTISNMNYGVKVDYSNAVVLENVDITAAVAALLNSNYGEKTITVKDSYLSVLGTWTRNDTTKTTIVFEGDNTVNEFVVDETVDIFKLADVNSTLTAPNDVTVVTDVEDYEVVYENGVYKLAEVKKVYVAQIGDTKYETLADAIAAANAAENGATITLLTDATVGEMMTIAKDVIIEGNGKTITWADGYNGTLFNVESGVGVTLNKLNIFGENTFSFYDDTTTVEDGQSWYTRFVDVGEEDKAINANVIVNAGNLTLNRVTIAGVTIASDGDNGKTANTETGGYYLMYNDDLAIIKSNGGTVALNDSRIDNNAGLILNAINAKTEINGTGITNNMGAGNKGGIIVANGGTMSIKDTSIDRNKAMARSATILGVINGAEVVFDGFSTMNNNKHIGVGSNTAGAMIVLEGASQFVMNGGSISNNIGGRAGAIASRWVGGSYGQHEDTSIVLNAGTIKGNTASNDSWNGASVFLRSPATIGEGMKIAGTIAVNAAPGALEITGGTFTGSLAVTDGLVAEISGGTFNYDPTEWLAEGYESIDNGDGTYSVIPTKLAKVEVELMPGFWGTSYITVENWADLVAALGENTNVPVKVTLLEDIKLTDEVLTIAGTAKKVIDLNGKRITGTFTEETTAFVYVTGGCELTILDSTVTEVDGFTAGGIHAINTNGNLSNLIRVEADSKMVIESGSYSQDASVNGAGMIDSRGDEIITIKGGHFRLYNVGSAENGSPWIFNASSQNTKNIIVQGGTFNADIIHQYYPFEVMAPKELALVQGEDGIWHFVPAVAYVNEQEWSSAWYTNEVGYATLEDAIAAVEGIRTKNGKTSAEEFITLLADAVVTGNVDATGIKIEQNGFAIKLAAADASLTAPEGLNVTTDVANRKVVYENGVYKLAVITYVAQIGDTLYETIQDAVYAAQAGDTIIVLVDHEMNCADAVANSSGYAVLVNVANQAVTIDLNGKVITVNVDQNSEIYGIFATDNNGKLTLMDSSADKTGKVEITAPGYLYSVLFAYGADSKLTVDGGRYVADAVADSLIYSQHNEIVEIKDGYFYLGNVGTGSNGKPWIFNAKGQNTAHAIVKGGTFNADIIHQFYPFEVLAPKELALVKGVGGIWYFVPAIAYINEQEWSSNWYTNEVGYATFDEAIAAVEGIRTKNGKTSAEEFITLLGDVMVTGNVDATGIKIEDNGFVIRLGIADATLTAVEGLNVITDLEGYEVVYEDGTYKVSRIAIAEIFFSAFGGSETSVTYPGFANSLQELVDYYMFCNNANETAIPGFSAGDYTPVLVIYGELSAEDVAYLGGASTDGAYVSAKPMTWTVRFADGVDASNNIKAAEGYVKIDNGDGTITIQKAVAKVGDTYFATLQDAFAACTNGETITLLVDLVYDADDVVPAHGGATGFGKYDQYNPSIIYIGGTKGATEAENQPSNVNAVLDLNGHTITNNADAYLFLFMDNCKVTIKDSKDGDGIIGNTEAPVIWVTGTDTLVTIENGKYTTANAEGLLWSTHGGDLVIKGGEFSTSADDASLLIVRNAEDRRNPNYFVDGKATVTIYGGTYYGFDPEKMMDDSTDPFTEFDACADGYKSIKNGNAYTVENYVEWIKQQLLLGNDVVLEKDIVVDGSMVESIPASTNGNGYYYNPGIFNVVGDYDVTFDLNGHTITYIGHEFAPYTAEHMKKYYYNGETGKYEVCSCTIAHGLFFANDGAHLTIVGEGDVIVNGVASGVYSTSPDTAITIQGGNWVNNGCAKCGATNLFLYASHGGELYIEGGRFEQALDSEGNSYLIVVHGGEYKNSVIDFAKTKIVVTGGTFVGMDPSKAHYFQQTADNTLVMGETVDTVPMGYRSSIYGTIDDVDVYDVVELKATVEAGSITYYFPGVENVDSVQELANFYFLMQKATGWILGYDFEPVLTLYAELTDEVVLGNTPSDDTTVTLPKTVTWTIVTNGFSADLIKAAEGYVKIDNGDGTITIQKAVAKIGDTYFATLQEAIDEAKDDDEIVVLVDVKLGWNDTVNAADGRAVLLNVEGKNITLNLNGKTITVEHTATEAADRIYAVVLVADGAGLTVIGDGAIDVTANETTPRVAYLFWKRGTTGYLVIEGGEYHMNHTEDSMVYTNGSDIVTVKGGSFTLDSIGTSTNGSPWIFNAQGTGGKHILITGGTFNADINRQHWSDEAVVDKTCYVVNNGDGTWTVKAGAVAYVNTGMTTGPYYAPKDIGYETIEEAFAAAVAANDSPITLLKNVMLKQNILISNSIELVPNGYTLDCGDYAIVLTDAAATLTAPEGLNVTTDVAGMKVVYEEGTYKVVPLVYVAQIGDTKYETLAEAILFAQPGDTIILLANVSEDVTINKSITLDGAYFEYTGNITVQGNNNDISVVIKKVNFGNGTSYAVTTSRIKSITIEDCTVTGRSLLYAKHSTPSIVVKNVTVTGGNYVANITYGSEAYFENVQAIGMTGYGIFTQNYGAKTITLKNCSFDTPKYSSIAVRDDRTSSIDTFIFEGNNVMTSLRENEHTKYVLADVDATLAAPEGYTVTTDLDHYKVVYEDGVYKVALKGVVVLKTEGSEELKYFDTIAAAMAEAGNTAGTDLIYLIADHTESVVLVYDGTTLDVQDKTLTADYLVVFKGGYLTGKSYSATRASGTIKIDKNRVIIAEGCYADATSALLPTWNQATSSYVFGRYLIKNDPAEDSTLGAEVDENGNLTVDFKVQVNGSTAAFMTGDTYENHGVSFRVVAEWTANGVKTIKSYVFTDEMVQECFGGNKSFRFTLAGASAIEDLTVKLQVVSDTGSVVEVIQTLPESSNQ